MENWHWSKIVLASLLVSFLFVGFFTAFGKLGSPLIIFGGICIAGIISYFSHDRKNPLALKKENIVTWIFFVFAFFGWMYNDDFAFRFSSIFLIIFLLFG